MLMVKNGLTPCASLICDNWTFSEIIDGKKVCPTPYDMKPDNTVAPYARRAVTRSSLPAPLPMSAMAGVTSPTIISGIRNPRNSLKSELNVTNMRTGISGVSMPRAIPRAMAIIILGNKPILGILMSVRTDDEVNG